MLLAHPAVLRNLIERYESLTALYAEQGAPEVLRRREDVVYTLCVSTGTRDIAAALAAARLRLPRSRPEDGPLVTA